MSLIRDYYYRFQVLVHEAAKFGIVGALGFVVQIGSQNALHSGVKLGPTTAVVLAYVVATVVTFVGNRYWAFKHRKGKGLGREFWTFVVLNAIAIVIQVAVVDLAYYGMDLRTTFWYNAASVVGIGIGTLMRFVTYRKFVFLAQPSAEGAETLEAAPTGH